MSQMGRCTCRLRDLMFKFFPYVFHFVLRFGQGHGKLEIFDVILDGGGARVWQPDMQYYGEAVFWIFECDCLRWLNE